MSIQNNKITHKLTVGNYFEKIVVSQWFHIYIKKCHYIHIHVFNNCSHSSQKTNIKS